MNLLTLIPLLLSDATSVQVVEYSLSGFASGTTLERNELGRLVSYEVENVAFEWRWKVDLNQEPELFPEGASYNMFDLDFSLAGDSTLPAGNWTMFELFEYPSSLLVFSQGPEVTTVFDYHHETFSDLSVGDLFSPVAVALGEVAGGRGGPFPDLYVNWNTLEDDGGTRRFDLTSTTPELSVRAVPEPTPIALLSIGLLVVTRMRRRHS